MVVGVRVCSLVCCVFGLQWRTGVLSFVVVLSSSSCEFLFVVRVFL